MSNILHVIYKTHLDFGFTNHAEAVRRQYHEHFIPMALDTGEHFLMEDPVHPKFVWTTGSWLIWDHLETESPEKVRRLERAIEAGIISWHALPFTTHTELMSPALVREALSISADLDRRFGKRTVAAKMTDVPGHTIGLVPLLAEAGVEFLHIGVNSASTPPDVPPLFRWKAPGGDEVVVAYHTDYGSSLLPEGMEEGLAFAHTMDNLGPQNVGHVVDSIRQFSEEFPEHEIRASTLDAFAQALRPIRDTLPVVTDEIGDTWIHGIGTAPHRVSRYLSARRAFDRFAEDGALTPARKAFGRKLMEVAEHTWGIDIKTYLRDETAWDRDAFEALRGSDPRFAFAEAAWQEQDTIVDTALSLLEPDDRAAAIEDMPQVPDVPDAAPIESDRTYRLGDYLLSFDADTGALRRLMRDTDTLIEASPGSDGLFSFTYETYDAADYDAYMASYLTVFYDWGVQDHGKPGLKTAKTARSARFAGSAPQIGTTSDGALVVSIAMPEDAHKTFGAPQRVYVRYAISADALEISLYLPGKPANRMPEAGFMSFAADAEPETWRMHKLGEAVSPLSVIANGNRQLHAVDALSGRTKSGKKFRLETRDMPLFSPGNQPFLPFVRTEPDMTLGGRFNLFNNKWGTNFSMWCDGDFVYRFVLQLED